MGKAVTVEDIEAGRAPRPKVLDMFAGGGAIPLEALRLGCEAYALDLNPVAHIIELCTLVYPQKYGKPDPNARGMTGPKNAKGETTWGGLANEVRYWGEWVLKKVKAEIGDLYPLIPDPEYKGRRTEAQSSFWPTAKDSEVPPGYLVPVAYLWTRTVRCKNPSCGATVPLVRQTWLCKKPGRYVALKMIAPKGAKQVRFEVVESATEKGLGFDPAGFSKGGNATCPFCGTVADAEYVKVVGREKAGGTQLLAVVCTGPNGRVKRYLAASSILPQASPGDEVIQRRIDALCQATGISSPSEAINPLRPSPNARGLSAVTRHGLTTFGDLFTSRQLLAHLTYASTLRGVVDQLPDDDRSKAVIATLALVVSRATDWNSVNCRWFPQGESNLNTFGRQALPMLWDFCETNAVIRKAGSFETLLDALVDALPGIAEVGAPATCVRGTATRIPEVAESYDAVVTDPPYYDNVPYADISDFFYVWLRRILGGIYPDHFSSELTPKKLEVTALANRHAGDMAKAATEYESLMLGSLGQAHRVLKPGGPLVVVYAHKTALGWSTLVDAIRKAGFTVSEAWPMDTEVSSRLVAADAAALASSIFLVARKREGAATGAYEDEVRPELDEIVRERVDTLWRMGITGADLVIAAVGAGLRAFTRFARVEYANGEEVPAEKFLAEVEGVVLETLLEKIFRVAGAGVSAVDGPTRFYVLWRYTYGAAEMDAGEAIVFTYGQNVELDGPNGLSTGARALVEKKKGKYRLRDFTERGKDEKLGQPREDGKAVPLIDTLHRVLWLMENEPRKLNRFLEEARPDRERLRLVAQTLAGTALEGSGLDGAPGVTTTAAEAAALKKLAANWRALVEQRAGLPLFESLERGER
jgi:putative DNA methylase